jgi:hypothetical protein
MAKEGARPSRLVPYLALAAAGLVGFGVAYVLIPRPEPAPPPAPAEGMTRLAEILGSLVLGVLLSGVAAAFYLAFVSTGGFTSNFAKPVFKKLKPRLFVGQIVLSALLLFALALLLNGALGVLFWALGIRASAFIAAMVVSVVAANVALVRLHAWAPLETTLASRRLQAMGVPAADLARGLCLGISNPAESGWTKAVLEDDVGFLWLEPDRLVYKGDQESFEVPWERLLEVERVVVASSAASAYTGNRHIVLRFATDSGQERRVRLHPEGCWTPGRVLTATNELADRLNAWRAGSTRMQ